jgi:WD40 repeat protein
LQIISDALEHKATLFDLNTGKRIRDLEVPSGTAEYMVGQSISPDNKHVLIASQRDRTARLWNAQTGALEAVLMGHTDYIWDAKFSPDGDYVATASGDGSVKLWSAESGHSLFTFRPGGSVDSIVFSPDARKLLVANGSAYIYSVDIVELLSLAGSLAPKHVRGDSRP